MKKTVLLFALLLSIAGIKAQEFHYGAKLALNRTSLPSNDSDTNKYLKGKIGFEVGFMGEYMFNDNFALAGELKYATAGDYLEMSTSGLDFKSHVNLSYVQVPVMARYYINESFSLEAGPQLGFLTSAKYDTTTSYNGNSQSDSGDMKDQIQSTDFGFNLGAGYKMENGLFINLRYTLGISDIDKEDNSTTKNNSIQFGVGYFFN